MVVSGLYAVFVWIYVCCGVYLYDTHSILLFPFYIYTMHTLLL